MTTEFHRLPLLIMLTFFCFSFTLGDTQGQESPKRPNVVLVMADDQGWGDMAYNGHPHLKTPNFDAMSKSGIRFDNFHAAAPVCSPTRASVLTGRTPNRMATFKWGHPIRPQEATIAEVLQSAGYRTGHFGKWHLGSVQKAGLANPGQCGFDEWVSAPNFFDMNPILSNQGVAQKFEGDSSDITADLAVNFIRKSAHQQKPFLAVVWFGSPHNPHQALPKDRELYSKQPAGQRDFLGEITAMDRAFGQIRDELTTLKIQDNTILWYCSDNGALPKLGSSGNRRGHKGQVYEGGLLVPAIIEWPKRFSKSNVIDIPCTTCDIYPTILDWTNTKPKTSVPLDGIALTKILEGKTTARTQPIGFWDHPTGGIGTPSKAWMEELYEAQHKGTEPNDPKKLFPNADKITREYPTDQFPGHSAWLDGDWKMHRIENAKANTVKWELYNLKADPKEANDVTATETERSEKMKRELTQWLTSVAKSLNGQDYPTK